VKLNGELWSAKAGHNIKAGSKVKVLDVQGVKLVVEETERDS